MVIESANPRNAKQNLSARIIIEKMVEPINQTDSAILSLSEPQLAQMKAAVARQQQMKQDVADWVAAEQAEPSANKAADNSEGSQQDN